MSRHGDNRLPVVELTVEQVNDMLEWFQARRDAFSLSARSIVVKSRGDVGDAGDVIKLANRVRDTIETRRLSITTPLTDARDAAISLVDKFWSELASDLASLQGRIDDFVQAEDDRIAAQRAEQDRDMEARRASRARAEHISEPEPPVPAPVLDLAPVRGDLGSTVRRKAAPTFTIIDVREIPLEIMNSPTVHEAIIKVCKDFSRHMKTIAGVDIKHGVKGHVS